MPNREPQTFRDITTDSLEGSLIYGLLLKHSSDGELLRPGDDDRPRKVVELASIASDLECSILFPCEPGADSGQIIRRRVGKLTITHYLQDAIYQQSLEIRDDNPDNSVRRVFGAKRTVRSIVDLQEMITDLTELSTHSRPLDR